MKTLSLPKGDKLTMIILGMSRDHPEPAEG